MSDGHPAALRSAVRRSVHVLHPATEEEASDRFVKQAAIVSVLVAILPIIVATVRAVHRGWLPVGENALFQIRAHDVFSHHSPLIGLASSASESTQTDLHHPGPLLFDLLAVPVALWRGAGVAIGVGALNTLAVGGVAFVARRVAGPLFVTLAMATTALLTWTMGSELLFDPWNPHSMLLPFWCLLFLAWACAAGDLVLFPVLFAVASLILQTHLSYTFLVPTLVVFAIVGFALVRRRLPPESRVARARIARVGAVSLLVVLVCWTPPLIDQFFSTGRGNLGALLSSAGNSSDPAVGYAEAPRLLATVVTLPPFWFRPSFRNGWLQTPDEIHATPDLPSTAASAVSLAVLAVALALCAWHARRRHDTTVLLLVTAASLGLLIGFVTAAQAPLGFFGLPLHFFRWLWALGAFAFFAIVATVVRAAAQTQARSTRVAGSAMVLVIVFAALNLPTSNQGVAPPTYGIPVMRDINRQLGAAKGSGTLLVDIPVRFNEPYGFAVVAELQRRHIPFVVERTWTRQVGNFRRFDGSNADNVLLIRRGDPALTSPRGLRRIAFHEGLSTAERRELDRLRPEIAARIRTNGLHLTAKGRAALPHGEFARFQRALTARPLNAEALLKLRVVDALVANDYLVHDTWTGRFTRYTALQTTSDNSTLALFLEPVAAWKH